MGSTLLEQILWKLHQLMIPMPNTLQCKYQKPPKFTHHTSQKKWTNFPSKGRGGCFVWSFDYHGQRWAFVNRRFPCSGLAMNISLHLKGFKVLDAFRSMICLVKICQDSGADRHFSFTTRASAIIAYNEYRFPWSYEIMVHLCITLLAYQDTIQWSQKRNKYLVRKCNLTFQYFSTQSNILVALQLAIANGEPTLRSTGSSNHEASPRTWYFHLEESCITFDLGKSNKPVDFDWSTKIQSKI